MGPTLGSIGNPLRMPMQYLLSIWRLFSLIWMSCSRLAFVFNRRARLCSAAFKRSFRIRTDSRISAISRCSLGNKSETLYLNFNQLCKMFINIE